MEIYRCVSDSDASARSIGLNWHDEAIAATGYRFNVGRLASIIAE
jgi:hypothetical protein